MRMNLSMNWTWIKVALIRANVIIILILVEYLGFEIPLILMPISFVEAELALIQF